MFGIPIQQVYSIAIRRTASALQQFSGLASTQVSPSEEYVNDFRITNLASKLGIKAEDVLRCVKASPELLASAPIQWQKCFEQLNAHGFSKSDHLRMVTLNPAIISMAERQELLDKMDIWRNCKLGDRYMLNLLAACPHLLSATTQALQQRIPLLKSLTKSNSKHLVALLMGNPNVMFENWNVVLAKVDYVKNVMDIDTEKQNISKSYLFNKDLVELKVRYMFLKRAGIYVNPPKIIKGTKVEQMQQPWSKNPLLFEIINTTDEVFINKVAKGLTLEELKVFRELYLEELEREESDIEEEEDDDDDVD